MNLDVTWAPAGAGGLVALFFILFWTGRIVARTTMDRIIQTIVDGYEGRLKDKDERIRVLTDSNDKLIAANNALLTQHLQSLEIGRTTISVTQALSAATSGGGADGANVGQATA